MTSQIFGQLRKTWTTPEVLVISRGYVQGGGAPGAHEAGVTSSHVTYGPGTKIHLHGDGSIQTVDHTVNFYQFS